jgi:hypothetical protein
MFNQSDRLVMPSKTTEIFSNSQFTKGQHDLPYSLANHCMVHIHNNDFFLGGGLGLNIPLALKATLIQNSQTGFVTMLESMAEGRAQHSCFLHKDANSEVSIVVTGGK